MNLSDSWTAQQEPLVRVSAAEKVFSNLRSAIVNGQLAVGSKLSSETALAQQYAVSRSVIREALRSCAALGLIETQTGKGSFVIANKPSGELMLGQFSSRSLVEARPHIEIPAAELAAHRRTKHQLAHLKRILATMENEDDPQAWVELDAAFHAGIAQASGNEVFQQIVNDIRDAMVSQSETINLMTGRRPVSDAEHRKILREIESGNGPGAAFEMSKHLAAVDQALSQIAGEIAP